MQWFGRREWTCSDSKTNNLRRRMNYTEIEWSYGYNWRFRFNFSESERTRNDWTILLRKPTNIRLYEKKSSKAPQSADIAAAIIIIGRKRKRNRKRWTASFLQRWNKKLNILGEVIMNSCAAFRNFTSDFELLLQLIWPRIKKQDTNMKEDTPISMHFAVTLHVLATCDSYRTLLYAFRISVSATSIIIPKVCRTITSLTRYAKASKK